MLIVGLLKGCLLTFMCFSGSDSLLNVFHHLGFKITAIQRSRWLQVVDAQQKRDAIKNSVQAKLQRGHYKRHAIQETGKQTATYLYHGHFSPPHPN
jgi:hypothetical protein